MNSFGEFTIAQRTWFITGVSSGFGRQLTDQLLERGVCVIGTVRDSGKVIDLVGRYPEAFRAEVLDVTDTAAIRDVVEHSFARLGRIDVIVSNAGYGLFGAAEELSDEQIDQIIATNLVGSIQLIRAALPHLRARAADASSRCLLTAGKSPSRETRCITPPSGASKALPSQPPRKSRPSGLA